MGGRLRVVVGLICLALPLLAACESDAAPSGGPAEWRVADEPALSIGTASGDSTQLFQAITEAFLVPSGHIVIGDAGIPGIRIFTADGEFVRQFGRSGGGPGEFSSLRAIWFEPPNLVGTWDSGARRVSRFTLEGRVVGDVPVTSAEAGNLDMFVGRLATGDILLASIDFGTGALPRADRLAIHALDSSGELSRIATVPGMVRGERAPIPFSPYPYFGMVGDTLLYTDGATGDVIVGLGSAHEDTVRVQVGRELQSPSLEQLATMLEDRQSMMLGFLDEAPPVESVPRLGGLLADDAGRVWTKEYAAPDDALWLNPTGRNLGGTWWVSTLDGEVIARVAVPDSFHPLQVVGTQVLGLAVDELGVQRVQVRNLLESSETGRKQLPN